MIMAGLADKVAGWTGDIAALPSVTVTTDNVLYFIMIFQSITAYHTVLGLSVSICIYGFLVKYFTPETRSFIPATAGIIPRGSTSGIACVFFLLVHEHTFQLIRSV